MNEMYCNNWMRAISKKDQLLNTTDEIYLLMISRPDWGYTGSYPGTTGMACEGVAFTDKNFTNMVWLLQ